MKRRLLIECGAAETRAAYLIGGEVVRFSFGPARGDEALRRPPQTGDLYVGRVRSVSKSLGGAFVDLGADREGFLPYKKDEALAPEGASIIVLVRRPPIGGKGAVLSADWMRGLGAAAVLALQEQADARRNPGALGEPVDAAIHAFVVARPEGPEPLDEVITNDAAAAALLRAYGAEQVSSADSPFETYGAAEALESALERTVMLAGGARLIFDQAEALTVVDVDAGAAADGASGRLNDKVNLLAAKALPGELARRAVGGRIVVDFLPPASADARKRLVDALKEAGRERFDARFGKLSADGLFDMTAPRTRLSLLEEATEPAGADWAVPGRRFSLDWRARRAVCALEAALAKRPSARPRLVAGAGLEAYLSKSRPQWPQRVAERYGPRFEIARNDGLEERGFDIIE